MEGNNPTSLDYISSAEINPSGGVFLIGNGISHLELNPGQVVEHKHFTKNRLQLIQSTLLDSQELLLADYNGTVFSGQSF